MSNFRIVRHLHWPGALLVGLAAISIGVVAQTDAVPAGTIQVPGGTGTWGPAPPTLPPGTELMVLEGNPREEGLFTMRLRAQAGARLQPHWHPEAERVTILSGLARVGFGDTFDEQKMTAFGPGSFYVNSPGSHHYVWIVEPTEMQLTGMGPWQVHLLARE